MYSATSPVGWHSAPHAHECFELLYVLSGSCSIRTSSGTHVAAPHHLVFFRPYEWHEETLLRGAYKVLCLRFPIEFVVEHDVPIPDPSVLPTVTALPQSDAFGALLRSIVAEYQHGDSYSAAMIGSYLVQFAVLLRRALCGHGEDATVSTQAQAGALQQLLDQYITTPASIRDMACQLHMSESHFSHQVKALLGVGPKTYVREQRIARARKLLRSTPMSVEEIAATLGYDQPTSFFRAFKRTTGLTPGGFRQRTANRRPGG